MSYTNRKESNNNGRILKGIILLLFLISNLAGSAFVLTVAEKTPKLLFSDIFLIMGSFLFCLSVLNRKIKVQIDKPILLLGLAYIVANLISLMVNQSDIFRAMSSIKIFMIGFLAYFIIISACKSVEETDWIFNIVSIFGAIIASLLITKFINQDTTFTKGLVELAFGGSNYVAAFLAFILPISLGSAISSRSLNRRMYLGICTILIFIGLVIAMSRGAYLSLIVGLVVLLPTLIRGRNKVRNSLLVAFYILILVVVVVVLLPDIFIEKNVELIQYRLRNPDYSRIVMLENAWNVFKTSPVFGIGPFQTSLSFLGLGGTPHNFVLQLLAESGILGAIPFLMMILVFLKRAFRNIKHEQRPERIIQDAFILMAIVVTLLHGLIEITFQGPEYMNIFWVVMAGITVRHWCLTSDKRSSHLSKEACLID